jgi:hypothetical protein
MKKIIFLLVIIVSSCGCKKDNSFNNSSGLIGKWSWVNTCIGYGTDCWTPTSTHTSSNVVFTSDSIYNFYQNDTLRLSSIFHTYKSISADGKYTNYTIKYDSGGWGIFSITHDTLSLIDEGDITFYTSHYKKIN